MKPNYMRTPTHHTIIDPFIRAGPLTKVTIAKDKEGNLKSFGFVCFKHTESVPYAISLLNGIRLFGRPIKLQYRFGSTHSEEPSSTFQGPDNGFVANQADYGMPVMAEPFTPGFPMPCMDGSYFSEAYYYFQGMMNQFSAFQHPPFGVAPQEPQPCGTMHPWCQQTYPPYSEPTQNCNAGPSSQGQNLKDLYDPKSKCSRARKRRREVESSDTESHNAESQDNNPGHKPKKRKKSKRRKL
ncbi:splicing regulator RBM11 isoform X2 [Hyla sarda]|uniref:splicing regulator RBM11 isoform X2 n=1 Tax=Hyla sarda TaxID=327740 RepID=UPI0024C3063B|nr:splicing regulator RBM11 isoform X2 [Hyla sarda]